MGWSQRLIACCIVCLILSLAYQGHDISIRYGVQVVNSVPSSSDAAANNIATFNLTVRVANHQSRGSVQVQALLEDNPSSPIATVKSQDVSSPTKRRNETSIPKLEASHSPRDDTTPNLDTTRNDDDTPLHRHRMPISIVVQLSGEMGNNLHKIAFGRALQNLLKERYQIMDTQLVFRRQERGGKWVFPKRDIQQCFPNLRHYDFELGNSDEFNERRRQQANWLGHDAAFQLLELQNGISASDIDKGLEYLHHLIDTKNPMDGDPSSTMMMEPSPPDANISLPFIYSQAFVDYSLIDRFYNDFRELFTFDELACCNLVPDADESVFVSKNVQTPIILLRMDTCILLFPNNGSHLLGAFISALLFGVSALSQLYCRATTKMEKQGVRRAQSQPNRQRLV
jgi:hypothetical protein